MIQKIVVKKSLKDLSSISEDLKYWLSRPTKERIQAVENFRNQYYGSTARLQRTARVIKRS